MPFRRALTCFALVCLTLFAAVNSVSSAEYPERSPIIFACSSTFAPFEFTDVSGKPAGIFVDFWRLWSEKTGIPIEIRPMDWSLVADALENGEADAVLSLLRNAEREKLFDLTPSFFNQTNSIFFHRDIFGIQSASDLEGFRVGVVNGDAVVDFIAAEAPWMTIVAFPSYRDLVRAAASGEVRVFLCDTSVGHFLLSKYNAASDFRTAEEPLMSGTVHAAVRKGDIRTLQTLQHGMSLISDEERQALVSNWEGRYLPVHIPWNVILPSSLLALTVFAGISLINRRLRRKVESATAALRQRQSELEDSRENYRTLIEKVPHGILENDTTGRITYANARLLHIMGMPEGSVVGSYLWDNLSSEQSARAWQISLKRFSRTQPEPTPFEISHITPDGETRDIKYDWTYRHDDNGSVNGFISVVTDVTGLKRTQRKLMDAHENLLHIIEFLPDATLVIDSCGRVTAWNRALERLTGVPKEEMLGKDNYAYAVPFYGRRQRMLIDFVGEDFEEITRRYPAVTAVGPIMQVETHLPMLGDSGTYIWAQASPLFDAQGEVVGAIESVRDISDHRRAMDTLRIREEQYSLAVSASNDGIWDWDIVAGTIYYSKRWKQIVGADDTMGSDPGEWQSRIHPGDYEQVRSAQTDVMDGKCSSFSVEHRLRHADGSYRWVDCRGAALFDFTGKAYRIVGALTDITDRKHHETVTSILLSVANSINTTRETNELYTAIHAILQEHLDAENFMIGLINETTESLDFVYCRDSVQSHYNPQQDIWNPGRRGLHRQVIRTGEPLLLDDTTIWQYSPIGAIPKVWMCVPLLLQGRVIGTMTIQHYHDREHFSQRDLELLSAVSDQVALAVERKRNETKITYQAQHDSLTGLPNRARFMERLSLALERDKRRADYHFAVVMIDLDRFKQINDTLGHMAGDRLLIKLSARIKPLLRKVDTIARLGGDEFALLLEEFNSAREVIRIIRRIMAQIQKPVDILGHDVHPSASAGIVIKTTDYTSAEELLRDSDIAMYQAKAQGKGRLRVFSKSMHRQAMEILGIENDLRKALQSDEFFLEFQPIINLSDGSLSGFEALVRWAHPRRGRINPGDFIPVAEDSGLILPLGQWVMENACRILAGWRASMPEASDLNLSINLSAKQLSQPNLAGRVKRILDGYGLPAGCITLEITETSVMEDPQASLSLLNQLKNLGLRLAIDDFGTGYSSLTYLQRFPVDTLKVDRSFVTGMDRHAESGEIVQAVVAMAHSLGLTVVAEGLENDGHLITLRNMRCDKAQGYHLYRPLRLDAASALITSGPVLPEGCCTPYPEHP